MTLSTSARPWSSDTQGLFLIVAGFDRLEGAMDSESVTTKARQRGYFTPDEEDRVRQMLLAFRNYRLAIYEIIDRYRDYEKDEHIASQLRSFIVGYAAALTLYGKSLKFVETYRDEPLVRDKLNEPESSFGLEGGFFEEVLTRYTSLRNYRAMMRAGAFWLRNRRRVHRLGLDREPGFGSLCELIRDRRSLVRRGFRRAAGESLFLRARRMGESILRPADGARYGLQAFVADSLGRARFPLSHPCFDRDTLARLRPYLRPGDVLLTRTEHKLTTAILPGFWIHALVYLGSAQDMVELGLSRQARVRRHWLQIQAGDRLGCVVHAISPRVVVAPLEACLRVDHAAVLRPRCADVDRNAALLESLRHVGKPYDFEFDFSQAERLVCTGLVYRSYHRRGSVDFTLSKRLGRYTLTCDELALHATSGAAPTAKERGFDLIALALQTSDHAPRIFVGEMAARHLASIVAGMRPSQDLHTSK